MDAVVVIPWRSSGVDRLRNLRLVLDHLSSVLPEYPVLLSDDPSFEGFSRAGARNAGVMTASRIGARAVVVCDADTLVEASPVRAAVDSCSDGVLHLPFTECHLLNSSGVTSEVVGEATGGVLVLEVESWFAAGGQDTRFVGWGFEDIAFRVSADTLLGPTVRHPGRIKCLHHKSDRNPYSDSYLSGLDRCNSYTDARWDRNSVLKIQGRL